MKQRASAAASGDAVEVNGKHAANGNDKEKHEEEEQEFGGPAGVIGIMLGSPLLMYLMAASIYGTNPSLYAPSRKSLGWFLSYHASQWIFARFMPGVFVPGQTGLGYLCNGYVSFHATIWGSIALHCAGVFDLTDLVKEYPSFLTTAIVLGNIYALVVHVYYANQRQLFSAYDFFIGVGLHPRIGSIVDVKMVAETRVSWNLLLLITIGSYIESTRKLDSWASPVAVMVLAHGLYGNACAKGEHFIPYTWDITTEKFGWMLCWWNLAGVPLLYCYNSLFIASKAWDGLVLFLPASVHYTLVAVGLCLAYWIWDEANYHKCYFKAKMRGELIRRDLFPTFRHVEDPKYLKCDAGLLLIDGWYAKARKIHYTADTAMAILWGLCCGFGSPLPYVYPAFFLVMIAHRCSRDEARCSKKYGETWKRYLEIVPYRFIPGVY